MLTSTLCSLLCGVYYGASDARSVLKSLVNRACKDRDQEQAREDKKDSGGRQQVEE